MNTTIHQTFNTAVDTTRPTILEGDDIDNVPSLRLALLQVGRSRDDVHEVRNVLRAESERLAQYEAVAVPCLSMQEDEVQKATDAALKAAEDVVKAQNVLHRNLMTLLGFRTHYEHVE